MNEEIAHRFAYHPPKNAKTIAAHERVRELLNEVSQTLDELLPGDRPREKAMMHTHLDEAAMSANACIARSKEMKAGG